MSTITVISTARRRVVAARRRVRRWGSDCHAAVAIEFVLLIPMLVGLLAFGNEAVGVRSQQAVLLKFATVAADAVADYHEHGPATGATASATDTRSRSAAAAVTSESPASGVKLLSLLDLTNGLRVLLAEIHPVGTGTKIGENPCKREATLAIDSANPFTCQIIAVAPTNQKDTSKVLSTCAALPAVWDKESGRCKDGTSAAGGDEATITNPTPCLHNSDNLGYRVTWQFGYDTTGAAKRVCKCANGLEVQEITTYDKKTLTVVADGKKNGGFDKATHKVPIEKPSLQGSADPEVVATAGVIVWAASYRTGLFTGILNQKTAEALTLQSAKSSTHLSDATKSTYEAAGLAHVDKDGRNMISCYSKDPTP